MKSIKQMKPTIAHELITMQMVEYITKGLKGGAQFRRDFRATFGTVGTASRAGMYKIKNSRHKLRGRTFPNGKPIYVYNYQPRIKIHQGHLEPDPKKPYEEYDHIHDDPRIGNFISGDVDNHVNATIAHEIAHAVFSASQHRGFLLTLPDDWLIDNSGHGESWQAIYGVLRDRFINPYVEACYEYA